MSAALYALASLAFVAAAYLDRGEIPALMTAGLMLLVAAFFAAPKQIEDHSAEIETLRRELERALKREAQANLQREMEGKAP